MNVRHLIATHPLRLLALALALVAGVLLATALQGSLALVGKSFPGFLVWDNGTLVSIHVGGWSGQRSGLPASGQHILSVDGTPFESGSALYRYAAALSPGTVIRYRIADGQQSLDYQVPVIRLTLIDHLATLGIYLAVATTLLGIGIVALWSSPRRISTQVLAFASLTCGALPALVVDYVTAFRLTAVTQVFEALAPAAVLLLALTFPTPIGHLRQRLGIALGVLVPMVCLRLVTVAAFHERADLVWALTGLCYLVLAVALGLLLVNVTWTFVQATDPRRRTRAAVVLAGFLPAFTLPVMLVPAFLLGGLQVSWTMIFAPLPLAPAAILYALLRHDLLDAERSARLTISYIFASTAVLVVFSATLIIADRVLDSGFYTAGHSVSSPGQVLGLVLVAVAFDPLRRRAQRIIDRIHYRSRVDPVAELDALSNELVEQTQAPRVKAIIEQRLERALGVEWAQVHIAESGRTCSPTAAVTQPVLFRDQRLGHIECGPKRSGAAFSEAELTLVNGAANQAALALVHVGALTDLRQAQTRLARREQLAAIGEFAGAVAHGIRNPLSGIRATAEHALQSAAESPQAQPLQSILEETDRLEVRIRALLDFSRPPELTHTCNDLRQLVDDVVKTLQPFIKGRGHRLQTQVPTIPVLARYDANTLEDAVLELVGNALQAMGTNTGRVVISVAVEATGGATEAVLRIMDTGPGIPERIQDSVFDLFFTTRGSEGTGFGLAAVKRTMEAHRGSVAIERSTSQGTVFALRLPCSSDT